MEAVKLKQVDEDYRNHLQAYLNFAVKAEKQVGKKKSVPVYKKFIQFFDYKKQLKKAREKEQSDNKDIDKFLIKKGGVKNG